MGSGGQCRWEGFLGPEPGAGGGAGALRARLRGLAGGHVWERAPPAARAGPSGPGAADVCGSLSVGDGLDDEWLLVGLLLRLSAEVGPGAAFRVWDDDGEFLLIEAAEDLPRWVAPDTSTNRVFLYGGEFHLVPRECAGAVGGGAHLREALEWVRGPRDTRMPSGARATLHARVDVALARRDHVALCTLPEKAARLLQWEPQVVAAAAHGLLSRAGERGAMEAAARAECFTSGGGTEVPVRFNRCLYARLMQEPIVPPRGYPPLPPGGGTARKRAELGLKVLLGLEIAAWQLRDPCLDGEEALNAGELLLKAAEWRSLETADMGGDSAEERLLSALASEGAECLEPLVAVEDSSQPLVEDSDAWMDNGEALLQQAVGKYGPSGPRGGREGREVEEMLGGLQTFLNQESSHRGAEAPSPRADEFDVDIAGILGQLKGALGLSGHANFAQIDTDSESGDSDEDTQSESGSASDEGGRKAAYRFIHRGMLDSTPDSDDEADSNVDGEEFGREYSAVLREQMRGAASPAPLAGAQDPGAANSLDGALPEDVDLAVVQNLLESVASQEGLPGPGSNLLGLLGVRLPADPPPAEPT